MTRTYAIGDSHGCLAQLQNLMASGTPVSDEGLVLALREEPISSPGTWLV